MFLLGLALISASALVSREVSMSTAPAAGSMPRISTVAFISTEGSTAVTAATTQAGGDFKAMPTATAMAKSSPLLSVAATIFTLAISLFVRLLRYSTLTFM